MKLIRKYYRPIAVACVRVKGPYATSAPEAWNSLGYWVGELDLRGQVQRAIGMYLDDPEITPAKDIRYCACIDIGQDNALEELPDLILHTGIVLDRVPGGIYASQQYAENFSGIGRALSTMRRSGLAQNKMTLAPGRPLLEIHHTGQQNPATSLFSTELCIPVLANPL